MDESLSHKYVFTRVVVLNCSTDIYNALTIHGLAERQTLPSSVLDIQQFWKITAYQIGDYVFSLDDIEHGILRGNYEHSLLSSPPCAQYVSGSVHVITACQLRVYSDVMSVHPCICSEHVVHLIGWFM